MNEAQAKAHNAVNYAMVEAYWLIGRRIVEEIQNKLRRVGYKSVSKALAAILSKVSKVPDSVIRDRHFGKKKIDSAITDREIDENPLRPFSPYSVYNAGYRSGRMLRR
jgi:hypothetical protein